MKKRANPDSEANIRRIDSKPKAKKQTHGFQVHFLRGTQAITKMFSDVIYGGKEGARRAARKFKRSAIAELPARVFRGTIASEPAAARTPRQPASNAMPRLHGEKPRPEADPASARPPRQRSSIQQSRARSHPVAPLTTR